MNEQFHPATHRLVAFSTSALKGRPRISDWQQALQRDLVPLGVMPGDRASFAVQANGVVQDGIGLLRIRSEPCVLLRRRHRTADAAAPSVLLVLMRSGVMEVLQNGRRASVRAGDGVVCRADRPFVLRFERAHELVAILLPRSTIAVPDALDSLVARPLYDSTALGPLLANFAFNLAGLATDTEPFRLARLGQVLSDLLGATLASMLAQAAAPPQTSRRRETLERAKGFIELHLAERELSPARVANHMSLTPRYLNKVFEAENMSLSRYIWARRLDGAALDLSHGDLAELSVRDIALRHGFKNLSHFSKAFRNRFQTSPKAHRERARRGISG